MTADPLVSAALLGTARMAVLPPAPDPALDATWSALDPGAPADALLQALAIRRAMHLAGAKVVVRQVETTPCTPESTAVLPPAAVEVANRLLSGEFPEVLPEWLALAVSSGRVMPARALPGLLEAATKNASLRSAATVLAGERGQWLARRHPRFSWLLGSRPVEASAWEIGLPEERLAWLRQLRATDPAAAAALIAGHWPQEDAAMREEILKEAAGNPHASDESWLESHALKDRRQELRGLASVALSSLPDSAFHRRAIERARACVKVERRLLKRLIVVSPPAAFDPAWAADGVKEKPLQGTGEKTWWLRQMVSLVPLDEWPALLNCSEPDVFSLPIDGDWKDALLLGWLDSARRMPARMMAGQTVPYFAKLTPWPSALPPREAVLIELLDGIPVALRFELLDTLAKELNPPAMLELLARCRQAPPSGRGQASLAVIDAAIPVLFRTMTRPQARALALCVPQEEIQPRLEALAKLSELPPAAEEFATVLEFRRSLSLHFQPS